RPGCGVRSGCSIAHSPLANREKAATLRTRRPRAVLEREACAFEQPFVDRTRDATQSLYFFLRQSCVAPRILQRATVQLDLERLRVALQHLRLEDCLAARNAREKRVAQAREVGRGEFRKGLAHLAAAVVNRFREQHLSSGCPKLRSEHVVHFHVDQRAVLHLPDEMRAVVHRYLLGVATCMPASTYTVWPVVLPAPSISQTI